MNDNTTRDVLQEIKNCIDNAVYCYKNRDDDWIRYIADIKVDADYLLKQVDEKI